MRTNRFLRPATVAILVSLFIALTLTPMLCSLMLGSGHRTRREEGRIGRTLERGRSAALKEIRIFNTKFIPPIRRAITTGAGGGVGVVGVQRLQRQLQLARLRLQAGVRGVGRVHRVLPQLLALLRAVALGGGLVNKHAGGGLKRLHTGGEGVAVGLKARDCVVRLLTQLLLLGISDCERGAVLLVGLQDGVLQASDDLAHDGFLLGFLLVVLLQLD